MINLSGPTGGVTLERHGDLLLVTAADEPPMEEVLRACTLAHEAGMLEGCAAVLVDVTGFVGSIDWSVIRRIGALTPWILQSRPQVRAAYLIRNSAFALVVKVIAALFPGAEHRVFTSRHQAMVWLQQAV
ncbi:hypothetical protein [Oleisolibacter albus]|uniref:hypothetical protein n=1 Tax=Oleisolibacter albus TaxID=2171757 RepID=UPI000DF434D2|nr:hypothetical protein [Oleisolibacter albus]